MADDDKVTIELKLDSDQFESGMTKATGSIKGLSTHGESAFTKTGAAALELNAILEIGIKSFEAIKEVFKETILESITAAMGEERALVGLNLAVSNSGFASEAASKSMLDFAEQMSRSSTMSKDMVATLETQAVNLSQNEEQAKKLTQAAIELSAATGKDAATSMQLLSQSMQGMTRGIDKLVPGMKNLSESELEAGKAADLIIQRFGGSAQAITETFGGRLQKLKNSFEELHEAIGKAIIQSPMINRAMEGITHLIDKAAKAIEEWAKGGGFEEALKNLLNFGKTVVDWVVRPLELTYNVGKLAFDAIVAGIDVMIGAVAQAGAFIVSALVTPIQDSLNIIANAVSVFSSDTGNKIKDVVNSISEGIKNTAQSNADVLSAGTQDALARVDQDMQNMFNFSFSENLNQRLSEIDLFMQGAKAPTDGMRNNIKGLKDEVFGVGTAFSRMASGFKKEASDLAKQAGKNFENIGKQMFTTIGRGAGTAFGAFGKAVATGQNALQAFANSVLATMGQFGIQLGSEMILAGMAYTYLGMPNGPPLIAAGVGLATLGGILSGLGGGGGGGSMSTDTSSSGGGFGGGFSPASPSDTPSQQAEPMQKKTASIIIQGDFLNSRETANHLQEIIRSNSDITDFAITAQGKSYA